MSIALNITATIERQQNGEYSYRVTCTADFDADELIDEETDAAGGNQPLDEAWNATAAELRALIDEIDVTRSGKSTPTA